MPPSEGIPTSTFSFSLEYVLGCHCRCGSYVVWIKAGGGALMVMSLLISVGGLSWLLSFFYLKGIILDSFPHLISHCPMCVYILFMSDVFIRVST
jgi:hypothetical protein